MAAKTQEYIMPKTGKTKQRAHMEKKEGKNNHHSVPKNKARID